MKGPDWALADPAQATRTEPMQAETSRIMPLIRESLGGKLLHSGAEYNQRLYVLRAAAKAFKKKSGHYARSESSKYLNSLVSQAAQQRRAGVQQSAAAQK
jgi:hypothetical protein